MTMYGSVIRRCRERVDTRTCLQASGVCGIACVIIYALTSLLSPSLATGSSGNTLALQCACNRNIARIMPQPGDTMSNGMSEVRMHKYLNIFNASEESVQDRNSINTNQCVTLHTNKGDTPVCVYDPKIDVFISDSLIKYGTWESDYMKLITSILTKHPDMQMLDVGSNIGVFTLLAAKLGRKVVAVDANKVNLRLLSKSVILGGLQKYVTIVWNAVTDVHETIKLTITNGNIGGSFVGESNNEAYTVTTALAITLEDLVGLVKGRPIFMKIDIEGSEWRAFRGGELFFREVNVKYILMEWGTAYSRGDKGCEIIKHMCSYGFYPYEPKIVNMKRLNMDQYPNWPYDVLWIKE